MQHHIVCGFDVRPGTGDIADRRHEGEMPSAAGDVSIRRGSAIDRIFSWHCLLAVYSITKQGRVRKVNLSADIDPGKSPLPPIRIDLAASVGCDEKRRREQLDVISRF